MSDDPLESPASRYPPTTAEWVSSPLAQEDAMPRNPLEVPPPSVRPIARVGAVLIIAGGALACVGLFIPWTSFDIGTGSTAVSEFDLMTNFNSLYTLVAILTAGLAIGSLAQGIMLVRKTKYSRTNDALIAGLAGLGAQVGNFVFLLLATSGTSATVYTLELGYWLLLSGFAVVLIGACLIKFIARPKMTSAELYQDLMFKRYGRMVRARRVRGKMSGFEASDFTSPPEGEGR